MLKMSPYVSIAVRTLHLTPLPITTEHNDDTEVVTVFLPHHHIGGGEQRAAQYRSVLGHTAS